MSDELAAASIPGAAIAITRGDQVLHVRGYGHDADDGPITEDIAFRIASLSKSLRLWPSSSSWMPAGCPWTISPNVRSLPDVDIRFDCRREQECQAQRPL
jgi:hypothetical protein